jgi:4'-phosphopantetheinyl transferase
VVGSCGRRAGRAPVRPADPSQTVRIWRTDLDAWDPARFLDVLSPDERHRRLRLRSEIDRQRAIVARGLLRELLGGALQLGAAEVPLGVGPWGKPRLVGLADPTDRHPVAFSQSRSGPMALFAYSKGRRIGVDVERIRPLRDTTALAEAVLAPNELEVARNDAGRDLDLVLLRAWTLKEAFLKAVGIGLACPPNRVELTAASLRGRRPPRLRAVDDDPDVARRWVLRSFAPGDGTVAALVIERPDEDHGRRTRREQAPSVAGFGRAGLLSAGTGDRR